MSEDSKSEEKVENNLVPDKKEAKKEEASDKAKKHKKSYTDEEIDALLEAKLQEKMIEQQAEKEAHEANNYASGGNVLLTDKAFILRLKGLNVPKLYLPIFRDEDRIMTTTQIWEKIRHSGIEPR